jgi:archaetidylinositol phosphate synthase
MLDGHFQPLLDRLWRAMAAPLVMLGVTPNQVTLMGLVLILANCAAYAWHRDPFWFGLGLALSFVFDALDGAVARRTHTATKFGGYLDAVVDRYQEIAVFFVIAWVTGWWALCFLALSGSLLTSYNKARTAIEMPVDNNGWPDLMERLERIIVICAGLIFDSFVTLPLVPGTLFLGLTIIALLSHVTALQRFFRARQRIRAFEKR